MNARQRRAARREQSALLGCMVKFVLPGCEGLNVHHREGRVERVPVPARLGPVWLVRVCIEGGPFDYLARFDVPMRNLRAVAR